MLPRRGNKLRRWRISLRAQSSCEVGVAEVARPACGVEAEGVVGGRWVSAVLQKVIDDVLLARGCGVVEGCGARVAGFVAGKPWSTSSRTMLQ